MSAWKQFPHKRVDVPRLRVELGGEDWKHKIPANVHQTFYPVRVDNIRGAKIDDFTVVVRKSSTIGSCKGRGDNWRNRKWMGTGNHRIWLVCPHCPPYSKWIPAGRLSQHYFYKHKHENKP